MLMLPRLNPLTSDIGPYIGPDIARCTTLHIVPDIGVYTGIYIASGLVLAAQPGCAHPHGSPWHSSTSRVDQALGRDASPWFSGHLSLRPEAGAGPRSRLSNCRGSQD